MSDPNDANPWLGLPGGAIFVLAGLLTIRKAKRNLRKFGEKPPPLESVLRHTAFGWEREHPRGAIVIGVVEMAFGAVIIAISVLALLATA